MLEKDEHRRRAPNFQQSCSILTFPIDNSYCNISPVEVSVVRTMFAQKRSVRHNSAFRTGNHCRQKFYHYSGGASGGGSACSRWSHRTKFGYRFLKQNSNATNAFNDTQKVQTKTFAIVWPRMLQTHVPQKCESAEYASERTVYWVFCR